WCSTPEPTRPLGREGAPLGQCRRASLLVDLAGDEMALLIEMVVDLGVNRAELLQRLRTSKPLHRPFSSSKRLMRILRAIVEATTDLLAIGVADLFHRRRIRAKTVGDDLLRSAVCLHDPLEKLQRRSFVPLCSDHRFQDLAFVIDGAPEIAELAVDLHEGLIQMPPELRGKVGDGVSQAADFISAASSIPSLNFTPSTTLDNWF